VVHGLAPLSPEPVALGLDVCSMPPVARRETPFGSHTARTVLHALRMFLTLTVPVSQG